MRAALVSIALLSAACPYHGRQVTDDDVPVPDGGPPDALPTTCGNAGETACDGSRIRKVCGPDHHWDPAQDIKCDFVCAGGECVAASANVPTNDVGLCEGASMHPLTPTAGEIIVTEPSSNQIEIQCDTGCGDANVITATHIPGDPGIGWFCLSTVHIPAGVAITLPPSGGPSEAIAFIVDGAVTIDGEIDFNGDSADLGSAGEGSPGAADGGDFSGGASNPGDGPCAGSGGDRAGSGSQIGAAGGGGAGGSEVGAAGGQGRSPDNTETGAGGGGGPNTCMPVGLVPLVGGSGGGGGADGNSCTCGWGGGGGGGAIQISSRASISIAGAINARGGDGFGVTAPFSGEGGGGGGGAGGAILLEAPVVTVEGRLDVDGGDGGRSLAGDGGQGASASTSPEGGTNASLAAQGGAGGGGSGGRVYIRALAPLCDRVSPVIACSAAVLQ